MRTWTLFWNICIYKKVVQKGVFLKRVMKSRGGRHWRRNIKEKKTEMREERVRPNVMNCRTRTRSCSRYFVVFYSFVCINSENKYFLRRLRTCVCWHSDLIDERIRGKLYIWEVNRDAYFSTYREAWVSALYKAACTRFRLACSF